MNLNKLTEKAQEAVLAAQDLAQNMNHNQVDVEHLLFALLDQQDGVVPQILTKLGADPTLAKQAVRGELDRMPKVYGQGQQLYLTQRMQHVFDVAQAEADRLKDEYISTEHLL